LNYHIAHFLDTNTFLIHNMGKFERGVACKIIFVRKINMKLKNAG